MGDILSQAQVWRAKAEESRTVAETLTNAVARDSLLEMADGYDQLADRMEDLAVKRGEQPGTPG